MAPLCDLQVQSSPCISSPGARKSLESRDYRLGTLMSRNPGGLLCAGPSEPKAVQVTMIPAGKSVKCLEGSNWEPLPPKRCQ